LGELTFFFDRNFGVKLPQALRKLRPEFGIEWHQQHFAQEAHDDEWLAELAGRGWTVLSHDIKFHSEATENLAVRQHKLGCFYLPGQESPIWFKAEIFFKAHRRMIEIVKAIRPPFIYDIDREGRFTKITL
jgi:hypothetical protein